ncbi:MAG: signal peptidase I [Clostridia bacterium]|nr:signal peptidase I [Clostridia bacterium]
MTLAAKKKKRIRRPPAWLRPVSALSAVLAIILLLYALVLDLRPVQGDSMEPTLHEGEWVLILRPSFALRGPKYGDLAVFIPAAVGDAWIKRVVGLPGDVLHAEEGRLYRNGEPVSEGYLAETTPAFSAIKSWSNEYLVLGDHRTNSSDSREQVIGAIPRNQLHGRAVYVIWPPSAWRPL